MGKDLLERFKRTGLLPSPPGAVTRLLTLCQDDEVSLADLIDTLAADPALSLRLLKYANSSLVGASEPITSVRDAVLCLGIRSVRLMALNFSLITRNDQNACPAFDYTRFWCHSVACGVAARHLARQTNNISPDAAFTAGLLAQIGKLVLAQCRPGEYEEILRIAGGVTGFTDPLESQYFGTTYVELSAELMEEWGIPDRLAKVVRFHKKPADLTDDLDLQKFAAIVGTATLIADILSWADTEVNLARYCENLIASGFIQTKGQAIDAIDAVRRETVEVASTLSMSDPNLPEAALLKQQANRLQDELALTCRLRAAADRDRAHQAGRSRQAPPDPTPREGLEAELLRRSQEAAARNKPLTLVLIDVDHFEQIIEQDGNEIAENLLATLSLILQRQLRSVDHAARFGKSTFAVLLTGPDHVIAAKICVRIRRSVETGLTGRGNIPPVTVSIGAFQWSPAKGVLPGRSILERTLQQLARSHAKGGNTCSMKLHKAENHDTTTPADKTPQQQGERVFIGT